MKLKRKMKYVLSKHREVFIEFLLGEDKSWENQHGDLKNLSSVGCLKLSYLMLFGGFFHLDSKIFSASLIHPGTG